MKYFEHISVHCYPEKMKIKKKEVGNGPLIRNNKSRNIINKKKKPRIWTHDLMITRCLLYRCASKLQSYPFPFSHFKTALCRFFLKPAFVFIAFIKTCSLRRSDDHRCPVFFLLLRENPSSPSSSSSSRERGDELNSFMYAIASREVKVEEKRVRGDGSSLSLPMSWLDMRPWVCVCVCVWA